VRPASVLATLGAIVAGACAGFVAAALLKIGANRSCLDVRVTEVQAACAAPMAAPWALAAGAALGATLVAGLLMLLARRRRG
jgi:ABC-type antimicrobial peptide transport system permease subunit